MLKRIVSAGLILSIVLVLVFSVMDVRAASSEKAEQIKEMIVSNYNAAKKACFVTSFVGLCGSAVGAQTFTLGIDTIRQASDGKDQFDNYAKLTKTTGGYRVCSYPSSQYTLRSAMDAITNDGAWDVYNLVVGFQKSNTAAGELFGHCVFVYAVLDGMVYFAESFGVSMQGKYVPEGQPIICSIDQFCDFYDRWTQFDGIAYLGEKTYANECQEYRANLYGLVNVHTPAYLAPGDAGVCEPTVSQYSLLKGQKVRVTAILQTPGGDWWLQMENRYFVPANAVTITENIWGNISVSNLKVPGALRKGRSFFLGGTISSQGEQLTQISVSVYGEDGLEFMGSLEGTGSMLSLADQTLDRDMTFRNLSVGTYRMAITATAQQMMLADDLLVTCSREYLLFDGEFRVVSDWNTYYAVQTIVDGTVTQYGQKILAKGETLETVPHPGGAQGQFLGWANDPEGSRMLPEDFAPNANTKVYAIYDTQDTAPENLQGWLHMGPLNYYLDEQGNPLTGWQTIFGDLFYFNEHGAQEVGWLHEDAASYYLLADGGMAIGWRSIDGKNYCFAADGTMQTGWTTRNGTICYLNTDGSLNQVGRSTAARNYGFPGSAKLQIGKQVNLHIHN